MSTSSRRNSLEDDLSSLSPRSINGVFVSYSWRNEADVAPLVASLAAVGFAVSTSGGKGDVKLMADGIDEASVVVVALSQAYKDSKSCKSEAWYSQNQMKPVVVAKLEKNCKIDGWLETVLPKSTTVIDYWSSSKQAVEKLTTALQRKAKLAQLEAECEPVDTHPILEAAKLGEIDQLRSIVAREGDYLLDQHHGDMIGDFPIHRAARHGRTEAVACLLTLGSSAAWQNKLGATPLHLAALMGHVGTAVYLLNSGGAEVKAQDSTGWLPIHLAAACGHTEMVELLLERAPDSLDARTGPEDFASTPLMEAARNGKVKVTRLLLDRGADRDAKNSKDNNALHLAAINDFDEMAEFLVDEAGVNIEERGQWGRTPLLTACAHGSINVARSLLLRGADLFAHSEADSDNASTATHLAAAAGSAEILHLIFTYVFESKDFQGRTPLSRAAINGQAASAEFLCTMGSARVFDDVDVHGNTALDLAHEAAKKERMDAADVVRILKEHSKQK